ncbi:hypothetical protein QQ045_022336 [Rhodiola kirilowii]
MEKSTHMIHTSFAALTAVDKDWLKGSIMLIISILAWASFFILEAITLRSYPAYLSLTTLVLFVGTNQSVAITLVMEHKHSVWSIGWDVNLLAAACTARFRAIGAVLIVMGLYSVLWGKHKEYKEMEPNKIKPNSESHLVQFPSEGSTKTRRIENLGAAKLQEAEKMIDDNDLGFFANFLGIGIFILVIAYHFVMAEPKYEGN